MLGGYLFAAAGNDDDDNDGGGAKVAMQLFAPFSRRNFFGDSFGCSEQDN